MNQEQHVHAIKEKEQEVQVLSDKAKSLYELNETLFQASKGVRTSEIDDVYKKINSTFNAKAKLEAEVLRLRKSLILLVMGE